MSDDASNAIMRSLVEAIGALNKTIAMVFPQVQAVASTATAGSATLPANPLGFFTTTRPDTGAAVKVPFYGP